MLPDVPERVILSWSSSLGSALLTSPAPGIPWSSVYVEGCHARSGGQAGNLETPRVAWRDDCACVLAGGSLSCVLSPTCIVIRDPLDVIASGPIVPDPTTFGDAVDICRRRGIIEQLPVLPPLPPPPQ
mmetsp:Transcript_11768/g.25134  ORF Transcript_11768/g.25134 Transcript_11768/m.25134 type:complete len:128 (+) Transcript_11768:343-726(+)